MFKPESPRGVRELFPMTSTLPASRQQLPTFRQQHSRQTISLSVCSYDLGFWWRCRGRWWFGLFEHLGKRKRVGQKKFSERAQISCVFIRVFIWSVNRIVSFKSDVLRPFFHRGRNNCIRQPLNPLFERNSGRSSRIDCTSCKFNSPTKHCTCSISTALSAKIIQSGKESAPDLIRNVCRRLYSRRFRIVGQYLAWAPGRSIDPLRYATSPRLHDHNYSLPTSLTLQKQHGLRVFGAYLRVRAIGKTYFLGAAMRTFESELRHA
jgi:hypothetical protein